MVFEETTGVGGNYRLFQYEVNKKESMQIQNGFLEIFLLVF